MNLPTIQTASGRYFNFEKPEASMFHIEDIAHALSHLCRFTGHTREFYSVAQHAVLLSYIVPEEDAFHGLNHDNAEAYLGDVAKPLKRLLPCYKVIEDRVEGELFPWLGLPVKMPASVKHADMVMLATERRDLMPSGAEHAWQNHVGAEEWREVEKYQPLERRIRAWVPEQAKRAFLQRFEWLSAQRERAAA